MENIPSDLIIIISGSSGIGKSTIARQLLKESPDSFIIEEWDLIRESIRTNNSHIFKNISQMFRGQIEKIDMELENILHCRLLNFSTTELTVNEILEQSQIFISPLISICHRIQSKGLCAIIEGVNLPIRFLLSQPGTSKYFLNSKNIVLVNLYATNYELYKERLNTRAKQRKCSPVSNEHFENIINYNKYNSELSVDTFVQKNKLENKVINIDVTSSKFSSAIEITKYIFKIVNNIN